MQKCIATHRAMLKGKLGDILGTELGQISSDIPFLMQSVPICQTLPRGPAGGSHPIRPTKMQQSVQQVFGLTDEDKTLLFSHI